MHSEFIKMVDLNKDNMVHLGSSAFVEILSESDLEMVEDTQSLLEAIFKDGAQSVHAEYHEGGEKPYLVVITYINSTDSLRSWSETYCAWSTTLTFAIASAYNVKKVQENA